MPMFISGAAKETASYDRLAHDEPFRPPDAGARAELRVAALDQLPEERRIQARCYRAATRRRLELRRVTVERGTFLIVLRAHVDHEGRLGRIVDEVVTEPLGLPGLARGIVAPQAGIESRLRQDVARRNVVGMP